MEIKKINPGWLLLFIGSFLFIASDILSPTVGSSTSSFWIQHSVDASVFILGIVCVVWGWRKLKSRELHKLLTIVISLFISVWLSRGILAAFPDYDPNFALLNVETIKQESIPTISPAVHSPLPVAKSPSPTPKAAVSSKQNSTLAPTVVPSKSIEPKPDFEREGIEKSKKIVTRSEILRLVNIEREKRGLTVLANDFLLQQAAQQTSDDHVKRKYAGHLTPEGQRPFFREDNLGYPYATISENLAYMSPGSGPADIVKGWMNSPGHRAAILEPEFNEAGVGITFGPVEIRGAAGASGVERYGYIIAMHYARKLKYGLTPEDLEEFIDE